ncbi:MAG TPA: STAS domain-containing protein [Pilimelia sp.]|nr:STAS domain-containing protein [Pilimelia sp.]
MSPAVPPGVTASRHGEVTVLHLSGELDLAVADALADAVAPLLPRDRPLLLDLTEVSFLDSAGVRMLDDVLGEAQRRGIDARIVAPPGAPARFTLFVAGFPAELLCDGLDDGAALFVAGPAA